MLLLMFFFQQFSIHKSRYADRQPDLSESETKRDGVPVRELCREHGISSAQFYRTQTSFVTMR